MRREAIEHFSFSRKAARVAALALLLSACKERTRPGSHGKAATDGTADKAASAHATARRRAQSLPSPELQAELVRRRAAWVEKPLSQGENQMTPERLRRVEMSRFELTSLAQEAAMIDMGLGEAEKIALRKILTDFRDAALLRIEHPSQGKDTSAIAPDEALDGIEGRSTDSSAPINLYTKRMRETLGEPDHAEFRRLELEERAKLIAGRRAFRSRAIKPTAPTVTPSF
jgi:hypothetical protein